MADTGAPWNLPYPLPTDLVRDGAQAIQDLAEATADGLTEAGNAGIGSNVVVTQVTANQSTASSTPQATDYVATITLTKATSKVLAMFICESFETVGGNRTGKALLFRGDVTGTLVQDAAVRTRESDGENIPVSIIAVDEPETTSPVTYTIGIFHSSAPGLVSLRAPGQLILIEVDA